MGRSDPYREAMGISLRRRRKDRQHSVTECATDRGVTGQTWRNWESGLLPIGRIKDAFRTVDIVSISVYGGIPLRLI